MTTPSDGRPDDFDGYWEAVLQELSQVPSAPEVEKIPIRTTDFATTYGVRLTGIGPYRLFAYLSIPVGEPPFPALYYVPGYNSVVEPLPQGEPNALRSRYITFSLAARGQRNSDKPYEASFPGLLTEAIDDPSAFVYRGIVADACRGAEYLLTRPEVDPGRVVALGDDLVVLVAALTGKLTHLVCGLKLFYRTGELAPASTSYPLEEINDYLRAHPDRKDAVFQTLAYFDPRWFAASSVAKTLVLGGEDDRVLVPLLDALGDTASVYPTEHSSSKTGVYVHSWIAEQFGYEEPILPRHWR